MTGNLEEIAAVFGVSRRTMTEWRHQGAPATRSGNGWVLDSAEVFAWRLKRATAEQRHADPDAALRRRKLQAAVEEAELRNKERSGELTDTAGVEWAVSLMIINTRDRLRFLGSELRDDLARTSNPAKCQELIDSRIREILTGLAQLKLKGKPIRRKRFRAK